MALESATAGVREHWRKPINWEEDAVKGSCTPSRSTTQWSG